MSIFTPLQLRDVLVPNRIWMAPMCMYSANPANPEQPTEAIPQVTQHAADVPNTPNDFHIAHYWSHAAGGAGMVMVEATAINPAGRITPFDLGLWSEEQIPAHRRLTNAIKAAGGVPAIQLAHAGRKASTAPPLHGGKPLRPGSGDPLSELGWQTVAPSPVPFADFPTPQALDKAEINDAIADFVRSAEYAIAAGYEVLELHGAHGYLLHQFLSPLSNHRDDEFGGSLENRMRFPLAVVEAVRAVMPEGMPLLLRVSATDWVVDQPAWDLPQTIEFVTSAHKLGIDLVDVSSGGLEIVPIPSDEDYQTSLGLKLRAATPDSLLVSSVGRIDTTEAVTRLLAHAGEGTPDFVGRGSANDNSTLDAVFIGRQLLRDAWWPNRIAAELGEPARNIVQYQQGIGRPR